MDYRCPADLDPSVERKIRAAAVVLFKTLGLRDIARFDFRLNAGGEFFLLEVNPLPGLDPESGDVVILARKMGWSHKELIRMISYMALGRYKAAQGGKRMAKSE